jgi:hypothetical protein
VNAEEQCKKVFVLNAKKKSVDKITVSINSTEFLNLQEQENLHLIQMIMMLTYKQPWKFKDS